MTPNSCPCLQRSLLQKLNLEETERPENRRRSERISRPAVGLLCVLILPVFRPPHITPEKTGKEQSHDRYRSCTYRQRTVLKQAQISATSPPVICLKIQELLAKNQ